MSASASSNSNASTGSASNAAAPTIDVTSPYTPRRPSPIVSISLNDPIGATLRKIKNFLTHKQTLFSTTFSIKVTPIVAMVSFFGVAAVFGGGVTTAFNFGKTVEQKFLASVPTPTPVIVVKTPTVIAVSKAGIIKATYANVPTPTVKLTTVPTESASTSGAVVVSPNPSVLTPTSQPLAPIRYILTGSGGGITFLNPASGVHLSDYVNIRVLVTGGLDSSTNTLSIAKTSDIEVLGK